MNSTDFGPLVEPREYAEGGDVSGLDIAELLAGFLPGAGLSSYLHNPDDDSIYGLLDKLGAAGDVMMLASPLAGPAFELPLAGGAGLKALSRFGRLKKAAATPKAISGGAVAGYEANEYLKDQQERAARSKSSDYRKGGLVYLAEGGDGGDGGEGGGDGPGEGGGPGSAGSAGGGPGGDGGGLGSGDGGGDSGGPAGNGGDGGAGAAGSGAGGDSSGAGAGDSGGLGIGAAGDAGQGLGIGDSSAAGEAGYGDPNGPEVGDTSAADPSGLTGLASVASSDTSLSAQHQADIQAAIDAMAMPDPDMPEAWPDIENKLTPYQALRVTSLSDLDPAIRFNPAATIADLVLSATPVGLFNSALSALGWSDRALGLNIGVDSLGTMAADAFGLPSVTLATNRDLRQARSGDLTGLGFGSLGDIGTGVGATGPASHGGDRWSNPGYSTADRFGYEDPYAYDIAGNFLPNYGHTLRRGGLASLENC